MRKINTRNFNRATRTTARHVNRQILLTLLREHQPVSRADLARLMQVGRGMVTEMVNSLIDDGIVYEGKTAVGARGRRPTLLYLRTADRYAVGVDIRFARIRLLLSDLSGKHVSLESFPTVTDPGELVTELGERIKRVLESHGASGKCEGIGVVIPGMVDKVTGRVLNAPQLGWRDVDIRDALSEITGLAVTLENAPMACALAHLWLGPGAGEDNFCYVTVAEGVGVGVVINGQVLRGFSHTAGEFGHVEVQKDGPACLCGSRGCLEACTSNLATLGRYFGYDLANPEQRRALRESNFTIDDLILRARSGDTRALDAIRTSGHYLGMGLSMLVNGLNPAHIYVGGEIASAWDLIETDVITPVRERALTAGAAKTRITPEPGSEHPRLRGATALVVAPLFAAPQVA
jgi:predicted NBD/HSP70 family sugar kinase